MATTKPLTGKASRSVHLATARMNVWEGAVRSGKTVASLIAWLRYVRSAPPGNLALVGRTERTLKRNIIDPLVDLVGPSRCVYRSGVGEVDLLGRTIYVAGANNVAAVAKIQGLTLAGAYGDEIATWPQELWEMLGTRLSVPGAMLFGTCNPAGPQHWLKRDWLDRAAFWLHHDGSTSTQPDAIDLHRFSFSLDDNPHLSPDFVAALRRMYVGLFYRRYILGEWVPAEGAIYSMWDAGRHTVKGKVPPVVALPGVGVDYGTTNAFAALMLSVLDDGRLCLMREWRWDSRQQRRSLTDAEYSERLRAWIGPHDPRWICVDPSAASFSTQLFRDGITATPAVNAVLDGIRLVSSLLAQDKLVVHESCEGWMSEVDGYSWDDKAAQAGEDKPIKLADHSLDAGRYAIATTEVLWRPHLTIAA